MKIVIALGGNALPRRGDAKFGKAVRSGRLEAAEGV
jgi:carbamate kinase